MFLKLQNFLLGNRIYAIEKENLAAAFDIIYKNQISFFGERRTSDGRVSIIIRGRDIGRFERYAEEYGIEYTPDSLRGLPVCLRFLKFRPMLVIGALLFAVWTYFSGRMIWDVAVEGNTKTDTAEIIALLEELGCGVGDFYPLINFNQLHADYSANQHDIAWLSVYMNGTVAEVQVRELWRDERERHTSNMYANVVADCAGVVEMVNVRDGVAAVRAGDIVRPGQVLISGIIEMKDGSVRYEYASGEVICTTSCPIHVEVNTKREEKVPTGRKTEQKSIKIFKKTINLFIKGGIEYACYDKIDKMEKLCPLGLCEIPVWLKSTTYNEYHVETLTVSEDDAVDEAMAYLSAEIKRNTEGAVMLSKSVTSYFDGGVYNIDCVLYLSRDIGRVAEFRAESAGCTVTDK